MDEDLGLGMGVVYVMTEVHLSTRLPLGVAAFFLCLCISAQKSI